MAFFKYVFQFTQGAKGFSEVYYGESDSIDNATKIGSVILNRMCALRPPLTILRKVRVSAVAGNRNSVPLTFNRPGTSPLLDPDVAGTSAVCNLVSTATGSRRQVALRGLPDDAISRNAANGLDEPQAQWQAYLTQFLRFLEEGRYMIRSLKKVGTSGITLQNITSIVAVANAGQVTVSTAAPMGVSTGAQVKLSQLDVKDWPGLNGIWTVVSATGNDFVIRYNFHTAGTFLITKGKCRNVDYDYGIINGSLSKFSHFGTRDTGRNPLGGRGRRPGVHIRSL